MRIKSYILSFVVGVFVFATLADVSKVLVSYSIYYYQYEQAKDACYNEKPDMYQSGQLFLKALIKRVNDICPNSKPKPPVFESNNLVLYINQFYKIDNRDVFYKLKNRFVFKFSYNFINNREFFRPPVTVA